ncbi:MAG: M28 family peptidase [Acidobacteriota bacterium]
MKKPLSLIYFLVIALVMPGVQTFAQRKAEKLAATTAASVHGNADFINATQLKDYLTFVASDEMEGRDTPSRGLDTTAKYIASQLSRWGVKPAGDDGSYFQRIAMKRNKIDPQQTRVEINGQAFNYGEDFLTSLSPGSASGQVVYASHGWVFKAKNIDAYQGIDVKGKIVVVTGAPPKDISNKDFSGKQGEDWDFPTSAAQKRGAIAVMQVAGFQTLANWNQSRQNALERGFATVDKFQSATNSQIPSLIIAPRLVNVLFQGEKQNATMIFNRAAASDSIEAFEFKAEKKVSMQIATRSEPTGTQNVIGVLEGSDPVLKNEYVAIGAHYDHVGIGLPVNGDAIYNGADDDGSGTVAVLAMAEAFARGTRPKRSILFIWHAGEEKGLWGSRYFTDYPTIPLNQIVACLNIDMIGRTKKENDVPANQPLPKPGEVFLIGPNMMSTELKGISEAINQSYLKLNFDYRYDDIKHPDNFFFRSDHYNYARKGIPIIFYMDGEHADYHRPSDHVDKIDFQNMEKIARTIFATAWELANRANRPKVDKIPSLEAGN